MAVPVRAPKHSRSTLRSAPPSSTTSGPMLVLAGAGSGQNASRDYPHRAPPRTRRARRSILRHDLHQQGRGGDERAGAQMVGDGRGQGPRRLHAFTASGCVFFRPRRDALDLRNGEFTIFDQGDLRGRGARTSCAVCVAGRNLRRSSHLGAHLPRQRTSSKKDDDKLFSGEDKATTTRSARSSWPKYRSALRGFHAFDFDDLVCEPVRLLSPARGRVGPLARAVSLHPGRRIPGHESRAARAGVAPLGDGIATSASSVTTTKSHLCLARGRRSSILGFRAPLSEAQSRQARTELPIGVDQSARASRQLQHRSSALRRAGAPGFLKATRDSGAAARQPGGGAGPRPSEAAFIADEDRATTRRRAPSSAGMAILYRSNLPERSPSEILALKERWIGALSVAGRNAVLQKRKREVTPARLPARRC